MLNYSVAELRNNYNCVACDVAYYGVFLINKGCKKNTLLMYSVILGSWMKKGFKEYSMLLRQNYKPNLIL